MMIFQRKDKWILVTWRITINYSGYRHTDITTVIINQMVTTTAFGYFEKTGNQVVLLSSLLIGKGGEII
jgi:hypothetical protein